MQFVANYWFIWVAIMILSGGYALYNQVSRMKNMSKTFFADPFGSGPQSFFKGITGMLAAMAVSGMAAILLVLAIIINLIPYFKG